MYRVMNTKNYGVIEEVKELKDSKEYGIVGSRKLMHELNRVRPDLINYDDNTKIANTKKAEELQKFLNAQDGFRNYELIFTY